MEKFKGTPGPWVWQSEDGVGSFYWLGPVDCSPLDRVADDGSAWGEYGASIEVDSPNANLIAAAPDLLEALQDIVSSSQAFHSALEIDHEFDGVALYDNAVKAIARALGKNDGDE